MPKCAAQGLRALNQRCAQCRLGFNLLTCYFRHIWASSQSKKNRVIKRVKSINKLAIFCLFGDDSVTGKKDEWLG
jgi:hypothetical protein